MQAVLPGAPRAPVRLLHARDDHGGGRAPRGEPATPARRRSGTASRATSAAAPATRTSSRPSRPWPDPRRPRWRPPKLPSAYIGQPVPRKEDPELITGRGAVRRRHHGPGHALGARGAQPLRARAHQRRRRLPGARHGGLRGGVQRRRPGRRVAGPAGLRVAGHRRHQDERALAARQGQGPPRRRRRRRGGGRHSRVLAKDAAELVEVDWEPLPAVTDPLEAMEDGAPLVHDDFGTNVVERLGLREGRLAGALQILEAVLRRPGPGEGEAPLPAAPPDPQRHGAARRAGGAQRGHGRVHDVHREPDPAHRAHGPGDHLRHPGGQAARGGARTWAAASARSSTRTPRRRSASRSRAG